VLTDNIGGGIGVEVNVGEGTGVVVEEGTAVAVAVGSASPGILQEFIRRTTPKARIEMRFLFIFYSFANFCRYVSESIIRIFGIYVGWI
jgi:hypothetical protein